MLKENIPAQLYYNSLYLQIAHHQPTINLQDVFHPKNHGRPKHLRLILAVLPHESTQNGDITSHHTTSDLLTTVFLYSDESNPPSAELCPHFKYHGHSSAEREDLAEKPYLRKSSRQREWWMCSMRTLILLGRMRPLDMHRRETGHRLCNCTLKWMSSNSNMPTYAIFRFMQSCSWKTYLHAKRIVTNKSEAYTQLLRYAHSQ